PGFPGTGRLRSRPPPRTGRLVPGQLIANSARPGRPPGPRRAAQHPTLRTGWPSTSLSKGRFPMPVNFQFIKPDGSPESVNAIDQRLCDHFGDRCDPKRYHWSYNSLVWEGLAILSRSKADRITPEVFDRFAEISPNAEGYPLFRQFLAVDYNFSAWYGPR